MTYHITLFKNRRETNIEIVCLEENIIEMLRNGTIFFITRDCSLEYYNLRNYDKVVVKEGMNINDTANDLYYKLIDRLKEER